MTSLLITSQVDEVMTASKIKALDHYSDEGKRFFEYEFMEQLAPTHKLLEKEDYVALVRALMYFMPLFAPHPECYLYDDHTERQIRALIMHTSPFKEPMKKPLFEDKFLKRQTEKFEKFLRETYEIDGIVGLAKLLKTA